MLIYDKLDISCEHNISIISCKTENMTIFVDNQFLILDLSLKSYDLVRISTFIVNGLLL